MQIQKLTYTLIIASCTVLGSISYYRRFSRDKYWERQNKKVYQPSPFQFSLDQQNLPESNSITLVTAIFDIGSFQKGLPAQKLTFTFNTYFEWMQNYAFLENDVVMFTDSPMIKDAFKNLRKKLNAKTTVVLVDRSQLWSFQLAPWIKQIFLQPGFPTHSPNMVNENYSCIMHAKYEFIDIVINENLLSTSYLAWVDIGYFRKKRQAKFKLVKPPTINSRYVSFLQVDAFQEDLLGKDIIYQNLVWIAGGFFIGLPKQMLALAQDYKQTVYWLLRQNLINTDQQVLYILYARLSPLVPRVPLQTHYHSCHCDWFYLGKICEERPISYHINYLFM